MNLPWIVIWHETSAVVCYERHAHGAAPDLMLAVLRTAHRTYRTVEVLTMPECVRHEPRVRRFVSTRGYREPDGHLTDRQTSPQSEA